MWLEQRVPWTRHRVLFHFSASPPPSYSSQTILLIAFLGSSVDPTLKSPYVPFQLGEVNLIPPVVLPIDLFNFHCLTPHIVKVPSWFFLSLHH